MFFSVIMSYHVAHNSKDFYKNTGCPFVHWHRQSLRGHVGLEVVNESVSELKSIQLSSGYHKSDINKI